MNNGGGNVFTISSRYDLHYNEDDVFVAFDFWHPGTNSFHFPNGMLSPTPFEVIAITSLTPTDLEFTPEVLPTCSGNRLNFKKIQLISLS